MFFLIFFFPFVSPRRCSIFQVCILVVLVMAGSHSFTLGDQLVERLLRDSRPSSRCNSPALSRCSSNRGSIYSEESTEPSIRESEENLDYNEREEDGQEDSNQLTISNVCSTCKEENQIRQALSVQQARQRYYTIIHTTPSPVGQYTTI